MDIKIQILGIFPSINNNNDKIYFKISNGKLYSLNECIKDNIIIPFFLQYNQDKKSTLPKIEIFLCSKFKNTVSEVSNASFEPFNNETKWITMNNGIKKRFSTYRLKLRCCFSIISSNQKKQHKYCNSMEHTNINNEILNSLNEDYEKKSTIKKNKKNSINITPTKKKNRNLKEDKGNNYSILSDNLINKKLDYEKNIPFLEKNLRNLMRTEENQITQDTNIADIQNDENIIKKKEKKLSDAISENSDNNKDILIPNNKEISARKIFEQNKIDLFLLYDDDYLKNIQNEKKENLKLEVDMILEKLFELSHYYHNAIIKKNARYYYYKNQYYLWLNDFLNMKKMENKFQINTKKKENKIDLNDKSIFNIFNLECNLIKFAGSWDSNQKNDKKMKLFEIFCNIILKHNNVLNKKNLNISQLNFILKNVKNYQSSQLQQQQQHQQQSKKKEPQNQLPTKRKKIPKHKN